jgi:hypothetical protein
MRKLDLTDVWGNHITEDTVMKHVLYEECVFCIVFNGEEWELEEPVTKITLPLPKGHELRQLTVHEFILYYQKGILPTNC